MSRSRILFSLCILLAAFSCGKQEGIAPGGDGTFRIKALSPETRTIVDGLSVKWAAEDAIGVFLGENTNAEFSLSGNGGTTSGTFEGTLANVSKGQTLYAYYPFAASSFDKTAIPIDLSEQRYAEPADIGKYLAMAGSAVLSSTSSVSLPFSVLPAVIVFTVSNTGTAGIALSKIEILAKSEALAETGTVDLTATSPAISAPAKCTAVSLNLGAGGGNGISLSPGGSAVIPMAVIPADLSGGFYLRLSLVGGETILLEKRGMAFSAGKRYSTSVNISRMSADGTLAAVTNNDLKVCSFNVRFNSDDDTGERSWDSRKASVKNFFDTVQPDLVGIQEPRLAQRQWLSDNLTAEYGYYDPDGKHWKTLSEYNAMSAIAKLLLDSSYDTRSSNAVLYKKSRFTESSRGIFSLSDTPSSAGSSITIDGESDLRCATWMKLLDRENGNTPVWIFNTHLGLNSTFRVRQAEILLAQIKSVTGISNLSSTSTKIFLTGDFNTTKDAAELLPILNNFNFAGDTAGVTDSGITYNAFGGANPYVCDFIFYTTVSDPIRYAVDRHSYGVTYISDHYPVLFDIGI